MSITTSRIKWQPTVLSFSFSSKELKANDPLSRVRSRLEDLDIKAIIPYVVDHTTHVVQNKRNTAKGLQALVNGKWIVDESYVDALVYAATPSDLENLESLSPLEADFDTHGLMQVCISHPPEMNPCKGQPKPLRRILIGLAYSMGIRSCSGILRSLKTLQTRSITDTGRRCCTR